MLCILQEVTGEKTCKPIIFGQMIYFDQSMGPLSFPLLPIWINLPILFCETISYTSISDVAVEIRVRIPVNDR